MPTLRVAIHFSILTIVLAQVCVGMVWLVFVMRNE